MRHADQSALLRQAFGIGLLSAALLVLYSFLIDTSRLHIRGVLNDQVGYISAARALADTGTIDSSIIFPAHLYRSFSKNYLYMPGHFASLASAYKLFGYGVFQSLLPSLASFVLTSICVFLIGERLYGARAGLLAALIFMSFPANLFFAFTAMAELTFLAAAAFAVCVGVLLPPRFRFWLGPGLVSLAFLFRETGALTVIPLAAMILRDDSQKKRLWRALAFCVVTTAVVFSIHQSSLVRGRPSIGFIQLFDESTRTVYLDAVQHKAVSEVSLGQWPRAMARRFARNLNIMVTANKNMPRERLMTFAILTCLAVSLIYGAYRRDLFALSAGGTALVMLSIVMPLYVVSGYRGVRIMMFTVPLVAVVIGAICVRELAPLLRRRGTLARTLGYTVVAAVLLTGVAGARDLSLNFMTENDAQDDLNRHFLENLQPNDKLVLVAPVNLSLAYVFGHYPVKWSFVPYNRETLALLAARYKIGTFVLPTNDSETELTASDLQEIGLNLQSVVQYDRKEYLIFRSSKY